ncbi:Transposase [Amphibacillus marinus]|uniref:Transposase n=1 Tax=Amphibacillus marinus TaxID=872970 RepID=A0A1H8Q7Q0_9BACI|nr:ISL3 family transposase [Amphibacillus marinus]SEO50272.1 Transposase [Amphibacillus marinus]
MHSNISLPGLEEFRIKKSKEQAGVFHIHLELGIKSHECPECHAETEKVHDYRIQKIQHTKIFARETRIFYAKRRYRCSASACGKRFYEQNSLVSRYQRQSKAFKQAVALELIHGKNFRDIALRFNTSPTTIMRRFDEVGASLLEETKTLPPIIAIDEYKGDAGGEKYQTLIADPIKRTPLEILPDRKKETVKAYLKKHGQQVDMVVMDMSPSFKAAVDQALGKPIVVADRFHFCRYINWALERVKREEQKTFSTYDRKKCKRMKHVFHKKKEHLSEKQHWYLMRYLNLSEGLRKAYDLKEAYRIWFEEAKTLGYTDLSTLKEHLYDFYERVRTAEIPAFTKAIETFKNWQKEILNSFAFDLHNGYIEGMNNQTKVIKRNAFGFRRFDRFRLKILLHHQYKHINTRVL